MAFALFMFGGIDGKFLIKYLRSKNDLNPLSPKFSVEPLLSVFFTNSSLNPFTPKSAKFKIEEKILNFILQNCQKQTAPHEGTAQ